MRGLKTCTVVGALGLTTGGAMYGIEPLRVASYPVLALGAIAITPAALATALVVVVGSLFAALFVLIAPFVIACSLVKGCAARRLLKRIDRLDRCAASDAEYDEAFSKVAKMRGWMPLAIGDRLRDEDCPSRRRWLPHVHDEEALAEVAQRASDPLAPAAWQRAMKLRHNRECDLPDPEIIHLWARAVASEDPFALPPELAATKELPIRIT